MSPYLEKALPFLDWKYTLEDLRHFLLSGDMQLWLVPGGVWVTSILAYPRKRVLELVIVAGEYQEWLSSLDELKKYARQMDCAHIEMFGRVGWIRRAKLKPAYTAYKVEL